MTVNVCTFKHILSTAVMRSNGKPNMIPVKTPVTPVTFSSSHFFNPTRAAHMRAEGCEQLHIIHWDKEQETPCASHPSC